MKRADTWMPIYWGDYLRDTMHLRAEGHGAYLLLIAAYWCNGSPLPDNDDYLSAVAKLELKAWQKLKPVLANFFEVADGKWRHGRIDKEIERANYISKVRQEAGKRGGKAKANATNLLEQTGKQNPTPSQSPSPEVRTPPIPSGSSPPKPTKGTRLAADWEPDEADRAYASERGVDPDAEAENFRDYWLAKPGSGGVKLDWSRTWKRWVRTSAESRGKGKPYASGASAPRGGLSAAILNVAADFQRRSERGHGNSGVQGDGYARGYGEGQDDFGGSPETDGDGGIIEGICETVEPDAAPTRGGNGTGDSVPGKAMPGTRGRSAVRPSEVARTEPMVPDVARIEGDDRHSGGPAAEDACGPILGGPRIAQDARSGVEYPETPGVPIHAPQAKLQANR